MPFTIPNYDSAGYQDQGEIDAVDFDILSEGIKHNGVLSGCAVSAKSPASLNVAVASGTIYLNGTSITVTGADVLLSGGDSRMPRFDLIYANASGVNKQTGTTSWNPVFPSLPSNAVLLAAVYVPKGATTITTPQIGDKRVIIKTIPSGASYLTLSSDSTLSNERVLVMGRNLINQDNGAGQALTIKTKQFPGQTTAASLFTELTSGTSVNVPAGATYIAELLMIGGGGGAGSGNVGATAAFATGGGGGCIVYAKEIPIASGVTSIAYAIGSGGSGGASVTTGNGLNGAAGGDTTLTVGSYAFTAKGGGAGEGGRASAAASTAVTSTAPTYPVASAASFTLAAKYITINSVRSNAAGNTGGAANGVVTRFSNDTLGFANGSAGASVTNGGTGGAAGPQGYAGAGGLGGRYGTASSINGLGWAGGSGAGGGGASIAAATTPITAGKGGDAGTNTGGGGGAGGGSYTGGTSGAGGNGGGGYIAIVWASW